MGRPSCESSSEELRDFWHKQFFCLDVAKLSNIFHLRSWEQRSEPVCN